MKLLRRQSLVRLIIWQSVHISSIVRHFLLYRLCFLSVLESIVMMDCFVKTINLIDLINPSQDTNKMKWKEAKITFYTYKVIPLVERKPS